VRPHDLREREPAIDDGPHLARLDQSPEQVEVARLELKVAGALGPRTVDLLDTHPGSQTVDLDEPALEKLKAFAPKTGDGSWGGYGVAPTRVFAWAITAEFGYVTGLVLLEAEKLERAANLGFTDGELVALRMQGPLLLISSGNAGAHPRLYDTRTRALQYSSDTARAVTFWP
jgi:hypothetical protein